MKQEAQLILTTGATRLAVGRGQKSNTIPLGIVSYCSIVTLSFRRALFSPYSTSKNVVTLKSGTEVTQCH